MPQLASGGADRLGGNAAHLILGRRGVEEENVRVLQGVLRLGGELWRLLRLRFSIDQAHCGQGQKRQN